MNFKNKTVIIILALILSLNQNMRVNNNISSSSGLNKSEFSDIEKNSIAIIVERSGDWSTHIDGLGDVNNDGYDDLIIGVRFDDEGGYQSGQAYLIYGKDMDEWTNFTLSSSDFSFIGENSGDWAGSTASGVGDINKDGYDDFIISALLNSEAGSYAGQYYLFLGGTEKNWKLDNSISNADATFQGENSGDSAHGVYGIGDVNNDSYDDFLLTGYTNSEAGSYAGQVYLFLGSSIIPWMQDTSLAMADASFQGRNNTIMGIDAAGIGDVNGDGYDDFAMGSLTEVCFCGEARSNSGPRIVDIMFGGPAEHWTSDTPISQANVTITGKKDSSIVYGSSFSWISGVGDVNSDGLDDFVIGSYTDDTNEVDSGSVNLFLGRIQWEDEYNLNESNSVFYGGVEDNWVGFSVAGPGDVNGDGFDDILIGAPHSFDIQWCCSRISENKDYTGETYLVLGRNNWEPATILSDNFITINGNNEKSLGYHLEGIGDVNADGFADFGISSVVFDDERKGKGLVHVIFGASTFNSVMSITLPPLPDSLSPIPESSEIDTSVSTNDKSEDIRLLVYTSTLLLISFWRKPKPKK